MKNTTSNEPDDYSNVSFHLNVCIDSTTREAARERETAACTAATSPTEPAPAMPANDTTSAQEQYLASIGAL